jgi:hypothetical protein
MMLRKGHPCWLPRAAPSFRISCQQNLHTRARTFPCYSCGTGGGILIRVLMDVHGHTWLRSPYRFRCQDSYICVSDSGPFGCEGDNRNVNPWAAHLLTKGETPCCCFNWKKLWKTFRSASRPRTVDYVILMALSQCVKPLNHLSINVAPFSATSTALQLLEALVIIYS